MDTLRLDVADGAGKTPSARLLALPGLASGSRRIEVDRSDDEPSSIEKR